MFWVIFSLIVISAFPVFVCFEIIIAGPLYNWWLNRLLKKEAKNFNKTQAN